MDSPSFPNSWNSVCTKRAQAGKSTWTKTALPHGSWRNSTLYAIVVFNDVVVVVVVVNNNNNNNTKDVLLRLLLLLLLLLHNNRTNNTMKPSKYVVSGSVEIKKRLSLFSLLFTHTHKHTQTHTRTFGVQYSCRLSLSTTRNFLSCFFSS